MGGRFGSPVLVVKPKLNRTGKISGFSNRFNRFFISVRCSQLIFHRFSRFFRLLGFFEHPYLLLLFDNERKLHVNGLTK